MATIPLVGASIHKRKAIDRQKTARATDMLSRCLGIQAEPSFDLTCPQNANLRNLRTEPRNGCLFKDVLEYGIRGEAQKIQLQVVDDEGLVICESKGLFPLSDAVELLRKLPLPFSPTAPQWLKDRLNEDCRVRIKTLQASGNKKEEKC